MNNILVTSGVKNDLQFLFLTETVYHVVLCFFSVTKSLARSCGVILGHSSPTIPIQPCGPTMME